MENYIRDAILLLQEPNFHIVLFAVLTAGVVRGFAGFGTGMIIMPPIAALYSPTIAIVGILVLDSWPNIPVVYKCRRQVVWKEIFPVLFGLALTAPLGLVFLKYADPISVRWFASIVISCVVILMWWGWQYTGPRTVGISTLVGSMCGFLGGSCSIPAPPALMYWMAKSTGAGTVRANMTTVLFLSEFVTAIGLFVGAFFTWKAVLMGILASPVYFLGQMIGQGLFGFASEKTYRLVAIGLILLVAITASPALDGLLR